MHLTIFQSGKGDCLLLSNKANSARVLVDGGMPAAYREHVAPAMGKLRQAKKKIDLVYVSHIDQDHIGGVLEMLDDEVAWRVHEHQKKNGNPTHQAPSVPRPPNIGAIWHNAFHDQVKKNAGEIEDALAAAAPILSGAEAPGMREAGLQQADLVASIGEAIRVSRRIGNNQLGIPLNGPSDGKLMMLRNGQKSISLGGMKVTILGPTEAHLRRLRKDWNDWLDANKKALQTIRDTARSDESRLGTSDLSRLLLALQLQAESFGDPKKVTPPNLASLTLLVEEGSQTMLLTGDAVGTQVTDGLKATGRLTNATFPVDVLKVPHHGSENNIDSDFCDTVIARDYVFCGNGEHENPNLDVIEMMARRRLAASGAGKFKFWFNSSEAVSENAKAIEHMGQAQKLVKSLAKNSKGRMSFKFIESGSSLRVV
jgi:beta-lactamase superfamily II metal-dependent hydrolase